MGFPFVLRVKNGRAAHDLTSPLTLATDLTILGEYPLFQLLEPGPMIAVTAKMPLVGALALPVSPTEQNDCDAKEGDALFARRAWVP